MNKNIKCIEEKIMLKNKLSELGICCIVWPRGPRGLPGTSITIKGGYDSLEELRRKHPRGNDGDTYVIDGSLYFWNEESMDWESTGHIVGPTGPQGEKGDKVSLYIKTDKDATLSFGTGTTAKVSIIKLS